MRKPKQQPRPAPAIRLVDKLDDLTGGKILAVSEPYSQKLAPYVDAT